MSKNEDLEVVMMALRDVLTSLEECERAGGRFVGVPRHHRACRGMTAAECTCGGEGLEYARREAASILRQLESGGK